MAPVMSLPGDIYGKRRASGPFGGDAEELPLKK
jgi:hypothetical protein